MLLLLWYALVLNVLIVFLLFLMVLMVLNILCDFYYVCFNLLAALAALMKTERHGTDFVKELEIALWSS